MNFASRLAAGTLAALLCWTVPASSQQAPPPQPPPPQYETGGNTYGPDELVGAGHRFFGNVSRGLASVTANGIVLVPIRSGLGLRLGANIGYLKYTPRATWNPF